jgi:hypothetical protein
MTAEQVFRFYRAYKFFYNGTYNDLQRYANIKCPPLLEQRDRQFYYRISQRLNDATVHALFTQGFFHNPSAHVSALATPETLKAAMLFAGRAENGNTLITHDLYELRKQLTSQLTPVDIDSWLYGEGENGNRASMPGCLQQVISGELPLDIACLLLLIPQPDLQLNWLVDMTRVAPDDMGLGSGPWRDRLIKLDQLLRYHRPTWRLDSHHFAQEFWHSLGIPSLAPASVIPTEPSLF